MRNAVWAVALFLCLATPANAETMRASFYGAESGSRCADGSRFHADRLHCRASVVCLHRCVVVTVRDRGSFVAGRSLDLSRGAARTIGLEAAGVATVEVRVRSRHR